MHAYSSRYYNEHAYMLQVTTLKIAYYSHIPHDWLTANVIPVFKKETVVMLQTITQSRLHLSVVK